MAIAGIGVDTAAVYRLEKSLLNPRFLQRVYGPEEQRLVAEKGPATAAANFAAKEAFGWDEKWHLAGQRTLEDGRLHGVSCRYAASQTWGMISYNINLRMGVDGKVYMPYAEALIGTYWPDAV